MRKNFFRKRGRDAVDLGARSMPKVRGDTSRISN